MLTPSDSFFLRFLWGPRKETLDQCVSRLDKNLSDLGSIDAAFTVLSDDSDKGKRLKTPVARPDLKKWLAAGVHRDDFGKVIPELGYTILWLCNEDESPFMLSLSCSTTSKWVKNVCSITFPTAGKAAGRLLQVSCLMKIVGAVVRNWQPDHGVVTTHESSDLVSRKDFMSEAGWITYLSENAFDLSKVPKEFSGQAVDGGQVYIATKERFSTTNPSHMKYVKRLTSVLGSFS